MDRLDVDAHPSTTIFRWFDSILGGFASPRGGSRQRRIWPATIGCRKEAEEFIRSPQTSRGLSLSNARKRGVVCITVGYAN